eukprot:11201143-Alexandrium_andersonii.AAC.1
MVEDAWHVLGNALPLPAAVQWLMQLAQAIGRSERERVYHVPAHALHKAAMQCRPVHARIPWEQVTRRSLLQDDRTF